MRGNNRYIAGNQMSHMEGRVMGHLVNGAMGPIEVLYDYIEF